MNRGKFHIADNDQDFSRISSEFLFNYERRE